MNAIPSNNYKNDENVFKMLVVSIQVLIYPKNTHDFTKPWVSDQLAVPSIETMLVKGILMGCFNKKMRII